MKRSDVIKSFNEIPEPPSEPASALKALPIPPIPGIGRGRGERVVNSELVKWKPVDKVAARVVAPAPEINQPPRPPPMFADKNSKEREFEKPRVKTGRVPGSDEEMVDLHSMAPLAAEAHEKTVKQGIKAAEELIERSREVIATIDYLSKEIGGPWAEYQLFIKAALTEVRENRIALGSETRLLMSALKEVRAFFIETDYQTEIDRLRDFVDVCERLRSLKTDGTLDALADTILKLTGARD